jgi:YD repeat-containing protein
LKLSQFAVIAALSAAASATAGVNPVNGNFFVSYKDMEIGDTGITLERTYNSRSDEMGWFGRGWGSVYETRLVALPDGAIAIREWGTGSVTYYGLPNATGMRMNAIVTATFIARKRQLSPLDQEALERTFTADPDAMVRRIAEDALPTEARNGILRSGQCEQAQVVHARGQYMRVACDGTTDLFDEEGRLVRRKSAHGPYFDVRYRGGIAIAVSSAGGAANFERDAGGLVTKATTSFQDITYTYSNGNLVQTTQPKSGYDLTYRFEYDSHHNMTAIRYIDDSAMTITYDADDRATSVTERSGDSARYEYHIGPDKAVLRTVITRTDGKTGRAATSEYNAPVRSGSID